MKSFFFVISLMSFVMYRAAKTDATLQGTWNGSYKTMEKMIDVRMVFGPGNRVELYSSDVKENSKAIGTYTLRRNEIAITCIWPEGDHPPFVMKGWLSSKQNYLDGNWESMDSQGGIFSFAKAGSK
jgi:hypothetical protein